MWAGEREFGIRFQWSYNMQSLKVDPSWYDLSYEQEKSLKRQHKKISGKPTEV